MFLFALDHIHSKYAFIFSLINFFLFGLERQRSRNKMLKIILTTLYRSKCKMLQELEVIQSALAFVLVTCPRRSW